MRKGGHGRIFFVVAIRGHLPDLPAVVPGLQWRRHRRPGRHPPTYWIPEETGRHRRVALAHFSLADGRLRVRHFRLRSEERRVGKEGRLRVKLSIDIRNWNKFD